MNLLSVCVYFFYVWKIHFMDRTIIDTEIMKYYTKHFSVSHRLLESRAELPMETFNFMFVFTIEF